MYPCSVTNTSYSSSDYPDFAVTVDLLVFSVINKTLRILLIQRDEDPFRYSWALPGGFVHEEENLESAAWRELAEETGIANKVGHLEQLRTYGDAGRDPRMRVVSVAYFAAEYDLPEPQGGGDAKYAEHVPIVEIPNKSIKLAFDHRKILTDAVERLRNKISYTPLATQFCPEEFTIAQLRSTYDIIWRDTEKYLAGAKEHDDLRGPASKPFELKSARPHSFQPVAAPVALHLVTQPLKSEAPLAEKTSLSYLMQNEETSYAKLDPGNFQRSVLQVDGFLEPTGKKSSPSTSGGRPAELFTVGNLDQLSPPIRPKKPSK